MLMLTFIFHSIFWKIFSKRTNLILISLRTNFGFDIEVSVVDFIRTLLFISVSSMHLVLFRRFNDDSSSCWLDLTGAMISSIRRRFLPVVVHSRSIRTHLFHSSIIRAHPLIHNMCIKSTFIYCFRHNNSFDCLTYDIVWPHIRLDVSNANVYNAKYVQIMNIRKYIRFQLSTNLVMTFIYLFKFIE